MIIDLQVRFRCLDLVYVFPEYDLKSLQSSSSCLKSELWNSRSGIFNIEYINQSYPKNLDSKENKSYISDFRLWNLDSVLWILDFDF